MLKKIIIAGGTGFIGNYLIKQFYKLNAEKIIILTRNNKKSSNSVIEYVYWDAENLDSWIEYLEESDLLINLTGKSVSCIFNEKNKSELTSSRINSVNVLNQAILKLKNPPKLFIQSSGLGYYGNTNEIATEDSNKGNDFLANLSDLWEKSFYEVETPNTRKICLRLGLAIGKKGGFLKPLENITKLFLGGHIGSGSYKISWFYNKELFLIINFLYLNKQLSGTFNVCSPQIISNKYLMQVLRSVFKQPYCPPVPKFIFKLVSKYILKIEPSLVLNNQNAYPKKLIDSGYEFKYLDFNNTINKIYN